MNERDSLNGRRHLKVLPLAVAVVLGLAGGRLLVAGTSVALSVGVLLAIAALAAAAVAIGSAEAESGPLDLSTRIGLGILGGLLAGLFHAVLTEASGWLGIVSAAGVGLETDLPGSAYWNRAMLGAFAGLALGAFWPLWPGRGPASRGITVGVLIALWQLFFVYPFQLGLGFAGVDAGLAVGPLVLLGLVFAGAVAGSVIGWGERAEGAPVSAPLAN